MCSTTQLLWLKGWLVLAISIKKTNRKKQRKYKTTCFPFNRELSPECVCSCHLAILTNTLILPLEKNDEVDRIV